MSEFEAALKSLVQGNETRIGEIPVGFELFLVVSSFKKDGKPWTKLAISRRGAFEKSVSFGCYHTAELIELLELASRAAGWQKGEVDEAWTKRKHKKSDRPGDPHGSLQG